MADTQGGAAAAQRDADDPFDLQAPKLMADIVNFTIDFMAEAIDSLEVTAEQAFKDGKNRPRGPVAGFSPQQLTASCERVNRALYEAVQSNMDRLELYALGTCFNVPPGLTDGSAAGPAADGGAQGVSEDAVAGMDRELEALRARIVASRAATREMRREAALLDKEMERCGDPAEIEAVAMAAAGKPSVAEDAAAIAAAALKLQPLLQRAQRLRDTLLQRKAAGATKPEQQRKQVDASVEDLGHALASLQP
ncbi:unnamed protein product [Pedinophyceae sp. YPF-701]|nr:unnamed protein product [Pedinophyceae sp. YPF-701]